MNMRALSLSSALLIAASSCGLEEQTTDSVGAATGVGEEVPDSGATRPAAPSQTRPALLTIPSDIFNAIPKKMPRERRFLATCMFTPPIRSMLLTWGLWRHLMMPIVMPRAIPSSIQLGSI